MKPSYEPSYKKSEYSVIHGMVFYGKDGTRTFVECDLKIYFKEKK